VVLLRHVHHAGPQVRPPRLRRRVLHLKTTPAGRRWCAHSQTAWAAALAGGRLAKVAIIRTYFQGGFALHERTSENIWGDELAAAHRLWGPDQALRRLQITGRLQIVALCGLIVLVALLTALEGHQSPSDVLTLPTRPGSLSLSWSNGRSPHEPWRILEEEVYQVVRDGAFRVLGMGVSSWLGLGCGRPALTDSGPQGAANKRLRAPRVSSRLPWRGSFGGACSQQRLPPGVELADYAPIDQERRTPTLPSPWRNGSCFLRRLAPHRPSLRRSVLSPAAGCCPGGWRRRRVLRRPYFHVFGSDGVFGGGGSLHSFRRRAYSGPGAASLLMAGLVLPTGSDSAAHDLGIPRAFRGFYFGGFTVRASFSKPARGCLRYLAVLSVYWGRGSRRSAGIATRVKR